MGQTAQKIIKADKNEIVKILNEAFCEEWLAYYQYWVGSLVAEGLMRQAVSKEFMEHAGEELEHAHKVADRIIQLEGTPVTDPKDWTKHAKCKYAAPTDGDFAVLLQQNLEGERCAIMRYYALCEACAHGNDPVTMHLSRHILDEELEHEQDIEDLIDDFESFKKKFLKKPV